MSVPAFRLSATVLDSPDPRGLAAFYRELLSWATLVERPDWVVIGPQDGATPGLAFQLEDEHVPPAWPAGPGEQQMQAHLDVAVEDLPTGVTRATALGASLARHQPQDDVRVLLDPDGHPFCLFASAG